LTLEEFQALVPPFEAACHAHMAARRLDGQPRTARQFTVYKHCPLPTPEDRRFFLLTSLKTYALQRRRLEHGHSSVKRCRSVTDRIRLWKEGVRDRVMEICGALHNFRVRLTSWQPMV